MRAECGGGKVRRVTFENVPAFAVHLDRAIEVPQLGTVTVDVAWGGMFYVIADAAPFGLKLTPDEGRDITRIGEMIKAAAQEQLPGRAPRAAGLPRDHDRAALGRAVAARTPTGATASIVSTGKLDWNRPATWTGAIDRSPCGTGTCAKMAALHAKGRLALGPGLPARGRARHGVHGAAARETRVGDRPAVVPTLSGQAWITGFASYVLDPEDPFPEGFTVGDIW